MVAERPPYSIQRCTWWSGAGIACRAGIDPATMLDEYGRYPCTVIRGVTGSRTCPHRAIQRSPADAEPGPLSRAYAALTSGRCPSCGERTTGELELEDHIYAMPCKHVIRTRIIG